MFARRTYACALLTIATLTLCAAAILHPPALEETQEPPAAVSHAVTFSVDNRQYTLQLENATAGPQLIIGPRIRPLSTRTCVLFPVMQNDKDNGSVLLTIDKAKEGTVFYLQSNLSDSAQITLTTEAADGLTVRAVPYGAQKEALPAPTLPYKRTLYDADSALYVEGAGLHFYLSRIALIEALPQSVFVREVPSVGALLTQEDGTLTLSIPLPAGQATCAGAATPTQLVHWYDTDAQTNVWNLDCSDIDYHLRADGVYITMPASYRPRRGDEPHIYAAATAWLLGPCTYETNGPLFTALGKSIVYSYTGRVNDTGFIPTSPSSTWLSSEYDIGEDFYDTRFNFDTLKRLMRAETVWNAPELGETVQHMLDFYLRFGSAVRFTVDEIPFVPDYGRPEPHSLEPTAAACSLNHYLAEGLLLLRAGDAYDNAHYTTRGYEILDAINDSAARWLRDNGDLWYAIRPDGQTEKNDYIDVTYLDLIDAAFLLAKLGVWDEYEGVQALLAVKEEWLLDHGHRTLVVPHPAYTAFSGD